MPEIARMRTLASLTIRAQDEERARLARELHESTAQSLAALGYELAAAARDAESPAQRERLLALRGRTGALLEEVRGMAQAMHPTVLDDVGVEAALEWLARKTRERTRLDVEVYALVASTDRFPAEIESTLYRVAQESLRNAEQHAGARTVRITLMQGPRVIDLDVVDDGAGFDVEEAETRRPGMGLFAMRERVALVHGQFEVVSTAGQGTRVHASIPVSASASRVAV